MTWKFGKEDSYKIIETKYQNVFSFGDHIIS